MGLYGGQTVQTLEARHEEHLRTDPFRFRHTQIIEVARTNSPTQAKLAEEYLINTLNNKFGFNCINARYNNGDIIQTAGAGESKKFKPHLIYIIYG